MTRTVCTNVNAKGFDGGGKHISIGECFDGCQTPHVELCLCLRREGMGGNEFYGSVRGGEGMWVWTKGLG